MRFSEPRQGQRRARLHGSDKQDAKAAGSVLGRNPKFPGQKTVIPCTRHCLALTHPEKTERTVMSAAKGIGLTRYNQCDLSGPCSTPK